MSDKKYYQQYRQEHREEISKYNQQRRQRLKQEVLDHYSTLKGQKDWDGSEIKTPCCGCCGETDLNKLEIDHIAGGGKAHRKSIYPCGAGGHVFYHWLKKQGYPEGYQTLCNSCNDKKRRWDGEARGGAKLDISAPN
jgi:5-methylcytosine-specific restriction endonuclease McrA